MRKTVIGPPGAGKTTWLSRQIERAVDKYGPDQVLVSSLTRTAATEIASRGIPVDSDNVGTLHALCRRGLGNPKLVIDTIKDFNAEYRMELTSGGSDEILDRVSKTDDDRVQGEYDRLRAICVPEEAWSYEVRRFASKWETWKAFTGTVDFTDLLVDAGKKLPEGPYGAAKAIFYDEAQDGSKLEIDLITQWAEHSEAAIIVGDSKQALYTWRGASVDAFHDFGDHILMKRSYRLPRVIKDYAEAWSRQIGNRVDVEYDARCEGGEVESLPATIYEPDCLVPQIKADIADGKSVMVLTTCGHMLGRIITLLKRESIPFHNPYRRKSTYWNPLKRKNSASAYRWTLTSIPWKWKQMTFFSLIGGLPRGAKKILEEKVKLDTTVDPEELASIVGKDAVLRFYNQDIDWFMDNLLAANRDQLMYPLDLIKAHGTEWFQNHYLEVDGKPKKGVIVGTVHSVKGGEADVVYLFPDLSYPGYCELQDSKRQDNVFRVMYVGLTRARERVVLCDPMGVESVRWL